MLTLRKLWHWYRLGTSKARQDVARRNEFIQWALEQKDVVENTVTDPHNPDRKVDTTNRDIGYVTFHNGPKREGVDILLTRSWFRTLWADLTFFFLIWLLYVTSKT